MRTHLSYVTVMAAVLFAFSVHGQQLPGNYRFEGSSQGGILANIVRQNIQFNGYTNHWHDSYRQWIRYGNLFKIGIPDLTLTIAQHKANVAEDLGIPGLRMQEGFLDAIWQAGAFEVLEDPDAQLLSDGFPKGNVLVLVSPETPVGRALVNQLPPDGLLPSELGNHQANAAAYLPVDVFLLRSEQGTLFVISATDLQVRRQVRQLVDQTLALLRTYDLRKGWFGAATLLKSVTCAFGHPIEVMGHALNEGCSFAVFHGYMDFWAQSEFNTWMESVGNPLVVDVGTHNIFGCRDYQGIQLQDMGGEEGWIDYAHEKGGYIFRPVYDPSRDEYRYDGYIATEGNKEQIDEGEVPFVSYTGELEGDAAASMVLFVPKGEPFDKAAMWKAILDVRAVSVQPGGLLMGPRSFRDPLNALLLDRVLLEGLFADRVNLQAHTEDYTLVVKVTNTLPEAVSGQLRFTLPDGIQAAAATTSVSLPAGSEKTYRFPLEPGAAALGMSNPLLVDFDHPRWNKRTMALLDLPRAVSCHTLLYGHAPTVDFPVSVHNFSRSTTFPVRLRVLDKLSGKLVHQSEQRASAETGRYARLSFSLPLGAGAYKVVVTALEQTSECQLGVGAASGHAYLYEDDLDNDGIKEYRMENDQVRLTFIATGARVIEYYIKEKEDNAFFKLWPDKPDDHDRPYRRRGFYPFGGFEDFLGQASMETHQVYDVRVTRSEGDYVRLVMSTDYFGNRLEKTYTLYGNSPLLEVRYALDFKNPEANVIGPQPILALGKEHGTEDVYTVPDMEGTKEFRMRPEEYYGQILNLREGWNAGYDSREEIAFVSAYPVQQPLFLHMWMNHDRNPDSHYFYNEFQPWVPIVQKTTMFFTFYMWGQGGHWMEALNSLQERNLISVRP
ncbi:MAG: hypothetical protein RLY31_1811 [Bacteroidota bacterium]|jgi:hypothetical protein